MKPSEREVASRYEPRSFLAGRLAEDLRVESTFNRRTASVAENEFELVRGACYGIDGHEPFDTLNQSAP